MNSDTRMALHSMAVALERAPRRAMFDTNDWSADIPAMPGVYALWDLSSGSIVYVGETSSLLHRMRDIERSVNHTCRRKLAARHNLSSTSEEELSAAIGERYVLSYLAVSLGRLELEEYLSLRYSSSLLNSPGRRLLRGSSYDWVPRD
jgi:hypothetical protein